MILTTLVVFVIVISILVFVHEYGHFLLARRLGVKVEEFGFGFPPRIVGFHRRGTIFSLNWIPFGGFVKLKGETPGTSHDPDSFSAQSKLRRFSILAAGVVMNYLLAMVLLAIGFSIGLPAAQNSDSPNPRIRQVRQQIINIEPNSPAGQVGLTAGDQLVKVNEIPISNSQDLKDYELKHPNEELTLVVRRRDRELTFKLTPILVDGQPLIGVNVLGVGTLRYPFPESIWQGLRATVNVTGQIIKSFGDLLRDLVVAGRVSPDLAGPVGIVVLTGQAYDLGFAYLLQFVALLSLTLAVVNFLPLPALDGGRALFVIIEKIRGRPVDHRIEALVHAVGFYVLIGLVLLVSLRDVNRLGVAQRFIQNLRSLFGS
ncbi:MAG: RIP metalloprotease RseP [Candidatus Kerfeldbacteria bacterium]|nr:RIP metalloprotease RseP [Candidatus Kerfeldbacteria bacterium]